jgi:transcriptional regulator with XRE-family HTH domain
MPDSAYLARLRRRQLDEGWTDEEMARQLQVSKASWSMIVSGQRQPGVTFLKRAMRRFPEYDLDVLFFLRSDVHEGNHDVQLANRTRAGARG